MVRRPIIGPGRGAVLALSTAGSQEEAARVAQALVERRLAACVNLVPQVRSIYRWQGQLCDQAEWLLVIKTQRRLLAQLHQTLKQIHSYEVPELVAVSIGQGSRDYLAWLHAALSGK